MVQKSEFDLATAHIFPVSSQRLERDCSVEVHVEAQVGLAIMRGSDLPVTLPYSQYFCLQIDSLLSWQHRFAAGTSTRCILETFGRRTGIDADTCRLHCQGTEITMEQTLEQVPHS